MIPFIPLLAAAVMQTPPPPAIIPQPVSMTMGEGQFTLNAKTSIVADEASMQVAKMLQSYLRPATGFALPIRKSGDQNVIVLRVSAKPNPAYEGYALASFPAGLSIDAESPAGLFYGVQTLRQLLPTAIFSSKKVDGQAWTLPAVSIQDHPRFSWRGAHMDVGRNFMPKEFVKKFLDVMALHKLNTFHWHLTEDQGWRIEIKKYPKLTQIGSKRSKTMLTYDPPTYDEHEAGGFYTQQDIKEIVKYAADRFITIVPEIEMPGHSQAAIASYPELGNTGKQLPVATEWGVIVNVYNVEDSTIQFLKNVLDEVMALFPGQFIHVGGDECPKDQWRASPEAQARIKQEGLKDEHELQSWFIRQIDAYLSSKGKRLIGWDEILEGGLAPGAAVMSWRGEQGGVAAAKAGHDVVMTPTDTTYFDYYQSKDHVGEPHSIGGFVPLDKVYKYEPVPQSLNEEEAKHILGSQFQLWTEYIRTPEVMEFHAYPRGCALAEVVWSPKDAKDYANFVDRLAVHLKRLAHLGVNFRPIQAPH